MRRAHDEAFLGDQLDDLVGVGEAVGQAMTISVRMSTLIRTYSNVTPAMQTDAAERVAALFS